LRHRILKFSNFCTVILINSFFHPGPPIGEGTEKEGGRYLGKGREREGIGWGKGNWEFCCGPHLVKGPSHIIE